MPTAQFFAPGFDEQVEQQNIERQRKMADLLRQQAFEPNQGQMVGGHYVAPSVTQHLAKLLQGYNAGKSQQEADEKQQALAEAIRARQSEEFGKFTDLLTGKPAQKVDAMPTYDDTGYRQEGFSRQQTEIPAVAPDMAAAYKYAAQARTPALQQFGVQGALTQAQEQAKLAQAEAQRQKYGNILSTPGMTPQQAQSLGVPSEVVKNFFESLNWGKEELVPVNGQLVGKYSGNPVGKAIPKQADAPNFGRDLLVPGADGKYVVNEPLVAAKSKIANAGSAKTNVSVNTAEKPFLTKLGDGIGEKVLGDFNSADSAVSTLNNVSQIESGLKNSYLGPAANARVTLSQIGEVLGVNGADETEKLQNTRNIIQGLARQELAAAGSMKGQGQITENERALLRRAESGDISELTRPELNTLLGALRKTAQFRINKHNANLSKLRNNPNAKGMVEFMEVQTPTGGGWSITPVN